MTAGHGTDYFRVREAELERSGRDPDDDADWAQPDYDLTTEDDDAGW